MKDRLDRLGTQAAVKGTMVEAHLAWLLIQRPDGVRQLPSRLDEETRRLLADGLLATSWVPFRCLIAVDRAIASVMGGPAEPVFRSLGRHSAVVNLGGVYKNYVSEEPHRFFTQMTRLHDRFQNFGRSLYERVDERAGRIRIEGYQEYSPCFCASGLGYYEGALHMMKVPGPVRCLETSCQCAGDPACLFDLSW
jgi:predicted hydrocarbon binding protein